MWHGLAQRLEGRLVVLEPLTAAHADALYAAARHREIFEWWPSDPAADRATFDAWIDGVQRAAAAGEETHLATLDARTGVPVGSTSFTGLRPEHRGLEIGWTWLTPGRWGSGANAEAKLLQMRHAFEGHGCVRVEFQTDELNVRSRRALEALPARFEGVLREFKLLPSGRRRSSAVYSVIESEWPAVRANLERRVDRYR